MKVKIDTREKFHVITILEPNVAANMTEKMDKVLIPLLEANIKNVLVNLKDTQNMDTAAASHLLELQHRFYELGASFVVCALQPTVKQTFAEGNMLEQLNFTRTEAEGIDILVMEEIERDLNDNYDQP